MESGVVLVRKGQVGMSIQPDQSHVSWILGNEITEGGDTDRTLTS